jgi:hypothetical protein
VALTSFSVLALQRALSVKAASPHCLWLFAGFACYHSEASGWRHVWACRNMTADRKTLIVVTGLWAISMVALVIVRRSHHPSPTIDDAQVISASMFLIFALTAGILIFPVARGSRLAFVPHILAIASWMMLESLIPSTPFRPDIPINYSLLGIVVVSLLFRALYYRSWKRKTSLFDPLSEWAKIAFKCPACGHYISSYRHHIGMVERCPQCNERAVVPSEEEME